MEEYVNELVENTLKKDNAKDIIVERILGYEMRLLEKDEEIERLNKIIEAYNKPFDKKEYMKEYRKKNYERLKEYRKKWKKENKDKVNAQYRRYYNKYLKKR